MPDVEFKGNEINDHVNENRMTKQRPLTECDHFVPYGPATGVEDPRAHEPKPGDGKEEWEENVKPMPPHNADQDPTHGPGVK